MATVNDKITTVGEVTDDGMWKAISLTTWGINPDRVVSTGLSVIGTFADLAAANAEAATNPPKNGDIAVVDGVHNSWNAVTSEWVLEPNIVGDVGPDVNEENAFLFDETEFNANKVVIRRAANGRASQYIKRKTLDYAAYTAAATFDARHEYIGGDTGVSNFQLQDDALDTITVANQPGADGSSVKQAQSIIVGLGTGYVGTWTNISGSTQMATAANLANTALFQPGGDPAHASDTTIHVSGLGTALQVYRMSPDGLTHGWQDPFVVNPGNSVTGSGSPTGNAATANVVDDGFYYFELDAALGTNDIWGPSVAGTPATWPAQADFKSADPDTGTAANFAVADVEHATPKSWSAERLREQFAKITYHDSFTLANAETIQPNEVFVVGTENNNGGVYLNKGTTAIAFNITVPDIRRLDNSPPLLVDTKAGLPLANTVMTGKLGRVVADGSRNGIYLAIGDIGQFATAWLPPDHTHDVLENIAVHVASAGTNAGSNVDIELLIDGAWNPTDWVVSTAPVTGLEATTAHGPVHYDKVSVTGPIGIGHNKNGWLFFEYVGDATEGTLTGVNYTGANGAGSDGEIIVNFAGTDDSVTFANKAAVTDTEWTTEDHTDKLPVEARADGEQQNIGVSNQYYQDDTVGAKPSAIVGGEYITEIVLATRGDATGNPKTKVTRYIGVERGNGPEWLETQGGGGIAEWDDTETNYGTDPGKIKFSVGSDGRIYVAQVAAVPVNTNPTADDTVAWLRAESVNNYGSYRSSATAIHTFGDYAGIQAIRFKVSDTNYATRVSLLQELLTAQLSAGGNGWVQVNGGVADGDGFVSIEKIFELDNSRFYRVVISTRANADDATSVDWKVEDQYSYAADVVSDVRSSNRLTVLDFEIIRTSAGVRFEDIVNTPAALGAPGTTAVVNAAGDGIDFADLPQVGDAVERSVITANRDQTVVFGDLNFMCPTTGGSSLMMRRGSTPSMTVTHFATHWSNQQGAASEQAPSFTVSTSWRKFRSANLNLTQHNNYQTGTFNCNGWHYEISVYVGSGWTSNRFVCTRWRLAGVKGDAGADGVDGTDGVDAASIDHVSLTAGDSSPGTTDTYTLWADAGEATALGTYDVPIPAAVGVQAVLLAERTGTSFTTGQTFTLNGGRTWQNVLDEFEFVYFNLSGQNLFSHDQSRQWHVSDLAVPNRDMAITDYQVHGSNSYHFRVRCPFGSSTTVLVDNDGSSMQVQRIKVMGIK